MLILKTVVPSLFRVVTLFTLLISHFGLLMSKFWFKGTKF